MGKERVGKVLKAGAGAAGAVLGAAFVGRKVLDKTHDAPPTQVVWYDGKQSGKLDIEEAAQALAKFLKSCNDEITYGIKALGKASIKEVDRDDLMTISKLVFQGCGIPMVYEEFRS